MATRFTLAPAAPPSIPLRSAKDLHLGIQGCDMARMLVDVSQFARLGTVLSYRLDGRAARMENRMSLDETSPRNRGGEKVTSRLREYEARFFLAPADKAIRAEADHHLDDLRLLMLTGYNPKQAHLPWDVLLGLVSLGLTQVSSTDMTTRVEALRMATVILSAAIGSAHELIDEADPLLEMLLLAVETACLFVSDELPRTAIHDIND